MASFFNLTLDTTAPSGLKITLNDGANYTSSTTVTMKLTLTDSPTTGYQMKLWGIDGVADEGSASWVTYEATKEIQLPAGDGMKTVHIKVRDDVGNESAGASANINLKTTVPVVTITGPDKAKISKISGYDTSIIQFTSSEIFDEYKVCVVPETNSEYDDGTVIGTTGGSSGTSGSAGDYPASEPIKVTIKGADLESASSGDGVKIVKVFVKDKAGNWSVT